MPRPLPVRSSGDGAGRGRRDHSEDTNAGVHFGGRRAPWLYDRARDPGEEDDVADGHPEVVAELERLLARWEEDLVEPLWAWRDEEGD